MSSLVVLSAEAAMVAGLMAILMLIVVRLTRSNKPDPKMAFLVELLRGLPK